VSVEDKPFFELQNLSFSEPTEACDLLHPEYKDTVHDAALAETQYFGFSVPDERICGLGWLWHHSNLGVASGGIWAWQGMKPDHLQAELFDYVIYASDDCLANDLHDYTLPNGYHVQTLEPMRRHRISYVDERRGNAVDIEYEAIMPAMVLGSGKHLEQAMRTKGTLRLGGTEYAVDGFNTRDRSWGEARRESLLPGVPPVDWMTGVFDEDLCFGCTAHDSLDTDPDWKGKLDAPQSGPLKIGWVYRDGGLTRVVSIRKRTYRNQRTLFPERVEMELTDTEGRVYDLRGRIVAASAWNPWLTHETVITHIEWELDGRIGHGDLQEGLWGDYIRRFRNT
jgi:hypothetical protein